MSSSSPPSGSGTWWRSLSKIADREPGTISSETISVEVELAANCVRPTCEGLAVACPSVNFGSVRPKIAAAAGCLLLAAPGVARAGTITPIQYAYGGGSNAAAVIASRPPTAAATAGQAPAAVVSQSTRTGGAATASSGGRRGKQSRRQDRAPAPRRHRGGSGSSRRVVRCTAPRHSARRALGGRAGGCLRAGRLARPARQHLTVRQPDGRSSPPSVRTLVRGIAGPPHRDLDAKWFCKCGCAARDSSRRTKNRGNLWAASWTRPAGPASRVSGRTARPMDTSDRPSRRRCRRWRLPNRIWRSKDCSGGCRDWHSMCMTGRCRSLRRSATN